MTRTHFVSFPRSGHHYVAKVLTTAFPEQIIHCDPYKDPAGVAGVSGATLIKNHGELSPGWAPTNEKFLVLTRDPTRAIQSRVAQMIREGNPPSVEALVTEFTHFTRKWTCPALTRDFQQRSLLITYEDVIASYRREVFYDICLFLFDGQIPNENSIDLALDAVPALPGRYPSKG